MKNRIKIYFTLFKVNFYISAFTFGGGYVVIPMMRRYFVEDLALITEESLLDMAAIAQSSPGAIAVNLAVLVGYDIKGLRGAVISCIATIMPPILILGVISNFYDAFRTNVYVNAALLGMEAGVAATIADVVIDMGLTVSKSDNILFKLIAPAAFIASFIFNINIILIILVCSLLSFIQVFYKRKDVVL